MTDQIRVAGAFRPGELPDDLRRYAKENAHRKINRLLERVSLAPFVAGLSLYRREPVGEPDRVALLTVSGWDPDTPEPAEPAESSEAALSDFYLHPKGVGDYLQRMPNNPICQLSIAGGFRGPNVHYTGGVDSLALMTTVAASHITDGSSDCALLVAFDVAEQDVHALPDTVDSTAAAVLLAPAGAGAGDLGSVPELLAALAEVPRPSGAVAALEHWLSADRSTAGAR
ncbi:hypothetical protein [Amycolatopsis nigrescens]|uniref:hypothetical protein n=1 Tax=Amycolatopsis nigrescens TaxID=381445 RepID=UPI0003719C9D|nr:hypothetical protein [Amycolatopsis nigrescens]